MQNFINFIKYHNAIPLAAMFLFLATGGVFASSPEARDAVYSSSEALTRIDNTALVGADLEDFNFRMQVTSITEDDDRYYVTYTYWTYDVVDGTWRSVPRTGTLEVGKKSVQGKDLGLYVAEELGQFVDQERQRLLDTQVFERQNGATSKVVTTEYSGIIGRMLDPEEKEFAGYRPVVEETQVAAVGSARSSIVAEAGPDSTVSGPAPKKVAVQDQALSDSIQQSVNDLLAGSTTPPTTATNTGSTTGDTGSSAGSSSGTGSTTGGATTTTATSTGTTATSSGGGGTNGGSTATSTASSTSTSSGSGTSGTSGSGGAATSTASTTTSGSESSSGGTSSGSSGSTASSTQQSSSTTQEEEQPTEASGDSDSSGGTESGGEEAASSSEESSTGSQATETPEESGGEEGGAADSGGEEETAPGT